MQRCGGLGLVSGTGVVVVLWLNARWLGKGVPLVAMALLGFSAAAIAYGDTLRAFGPGMCLGLLAFGLFWQLTQRPGRWLVIGAGIVAVLSVHMVYYNTVLLLACGCGSAAVLVRHRRWRAATVPLLIGLVAGLSMLAYLPTFRSAGEWNAILRYPTDVNTVLDTLYLALGHERRCVPVAVDGSDDRGGGDGRVGRKSPASGAAWPRGSGTWRCSAARR